MKVLVACEYSGIITKAFRSIGHDAFSCDIIDTEGDSRYHIKDDVLHHLNDGWDLMIAHPPCQYLSNAGNRWFSAKYGEMSIKRQINRVNAVEFFMHLYEANIQHKCIENPVGYINRLIKPTQIIQPYEFGDSESKRTCLWLINLPKLIHTNIVIPTIHGYFKSGKNKGKPIYFSDSINSKNRAKDRAKTFIGIANAMAMQWG